MSCHRDPSVSSADSPKSCIRRAGALSSLISISCGILLFYGFVYIVLTIPLYSRAGTAHSASWEGSRGTVARLGALSHGDDMRGFLIRKHSFWSHGTTYRIAYAIGRRDAEAAEQTFGYSEQELKDHLNAVVRDYNARYRWKIWVHLVGKSRYTYLARPDYKFLGVEFRNTYDIAISSFLESHYFKITNNKINVDFPAVQLWQAPLVKPLFRKLLSQARLRHMNERQFTSFIAAFVQGFTYRIPPDTQGSKFINGVWPPMICLREMAGDCDTKSLLFATLYYHYHRKGSIMLLINNHAFVGVRNQHCILPGDHKVTLHGQDYILLETTNYFDLGDISPDVWSDVQRKHARYVAFN